MTALSKKFSRESANVDQKRKDRDDVA